MIDLIWPPGGIAEGISSPMADTSSRKDSLSLNVEFIKVNISRSRKGIVQGDCPLAASQSTSKLNTTHDSQTKAANCVRFSGKLIIGQHDLAQHFSPVRR